MSNVYDVTIIGCGPAGMTAAIYATRANLKVCMIEKSVPGGQMTKTAEIENYPGFELIDGPELSMKMFEHSQKLGAEYKYGNVMEVSDQDDLKLVKTDMEEILTKTVVVATGMKQREMNVPGEKELSGRGISWCAICDGAFFKGKDVVVVGGGNSAVEEALYLANIANKVTIIHRRDELRADRVAQDRAFENSKIEFAWDSVVKSFNEVDGKLGNVTIENVKTNEQSQIKADGAFIYIGSDPITDMVKNYGILDQAGFVHVNHKMETEAKGIFSAGDVTVKDLRQVATAVSDGANAAQSASKYIELMEK